jgi:hypothetical protein
MKLFLKPFRQRHIIRIHHRNQLTTTHFYANILSSTNTNILCKGNKLKSFYLARRLFFWRAVFRKIKIFLRGSKGNNFQGISQPLFPFFNSLVRMMCRCLNGLRNSWQYLRIKMLIFAVLG